MVLLKAAFNVPLKNNDYDVIVIGAGIQGAGAAQACAAQGWKVAILEKAAVAAEGTSSSSSKLIHGGYVT